MAEGVLLSAECKLWMIPSGGGRTEHDCKPRRGKVQKYGRRRSAWRGRTDDNVERQQEEQALENCQRISLMRSIQT